MIETVFSERLDDDALVRMCACGNRLIDEIPLQRPISCVLFDGQGAELARFPLDADDPTQTNCDAIEAEMRSQTGASLCLTDAKGVVVEVLLVIGTQILQ